MLLRLVMHWWWGRANDPEIDDLIAKNTAQPRKEMQQVDYRKLELAGARVWQRALRAQRRQNGR